MTPTSTCTMAEAYVIPDFSRATARALGRAVLAASGATVLLAVGSGALTGVWDVFYTLLGIVISSTIAFAYVASKYKGLLERNWERHSFAWYCEAFPHAARAGMEVACRHCGSGRVTVKNLMNHTFMRSHCCENCGETLYFSREKM